MTKIIPISYFATKLGQGSFISWLWAVPLLWLAWASVGTAGREAPLCAWADDMSVQVTPNSGTSDEVAVRGFVQKIIDETLSVVNSNVSDGVKTQKLQKIFENCVDIEGMAKMALGKRWLNLEPQQRANYLASYRRYLLKTFIPKFKDYNSQKVIINKIIPIDNRKFNVNMQLIPASGSAKTSGSAQKININYRIVWLDGQRAGGLKIRDIIIEEMSLMRTQREDFASTMNSSGIAGLLAALDAK